MILNLTLIYFLTNKFKDMKTKKQTFYVKDFAVNTISDTFGGELMDTQVFINDTFICVIAGCYIGDFVNDLRKLVNDYSI